MILPSCECDTHTHAYTQGSQTHTNMLALALARTSVLHGALPCCLRTILLCVCLCVSVCVGTPHVGCGTCSTSPAVPGVRVPLSSRQSSHGYRTCQQHSSHTHLSNSWRQEQRVREALCTPWLCYVPVAYLSTLVFLRTCTDVYMRMHVCVCLSMRSCVSVCVYVSVTPRLLHGRCSRTLQSGCRSSV